MTSPPTLQLAMYYLLFCASGFCYTTVWHPSETTIETEHGEHTFGIEFALDYVLASVTLKNESTYALSRIAGDDEYKSLMRNYLDICYRIYLTQKSPSLSNEPKQVWTEARQVRSEWQERLMGKRIQLWWEILMARILRAPLYALGIFQNGQSDIDTEVNVLTRAVRDLKEASIEQMSRRFKITESHDWAYSSVVAPDFFWTVIEPEAPYYSDDTKSWRENRDKGDLWVGQTLSRFSMALYRNEYRLEVSSNREDLLPSSTSIYDITSTSETLPFGEQQCLSQEMGTHSAHGICQPNTLSRTSTIVNFSNASLSLWFKGPVWTPWNTYPELGGHALANCKDEDACMSAHWDAAIVKLRTLGFLASNSDIHEEHDMNLVLAGECWNTTTIARFRERLRFHGIFEEVGIKNEVYQLDIYAASMRAARWGWYRLLESHSCCQLVDQIAHDEL